MCPQGGHAPGSSKPRPPKARPGPCPQGGKGVGGVEELSSLLRRDALGSTVWWVGAEEDGSVGSSHLPFLDHLLPTTWGDSKVASTAPRALFCAVRALVRAECCWAREVGWGWPEQPRTLLIQATWPQGRQGACVPPA